MTEGAASPWNSLLAAPDSDDEECLMNTSMGKLSPDRQRFVQTPIKIEKECERAYEHGRQSSSRSAKPMNVFEAFCSTSSRLTQQVICLGGRAQR